MSLLSLHLPSLPSSSPFFPPSDPLSPVSPTSLSPTWTFNGEFSGLMLGLCILSCCFLARSASQRIICILKYGQNCPQRDEEETRSSLSSSLTTKCWKGTVINVINCLNFRIIQRVFHIINIFFPLIYLKLLLISPPPPAYKPPGYRPIYL